jgi:hypothetical protein
MPEPLSAPDLGAAGLELVETHAVEAEPSPEIEAAGEAVSESAPDKPARRRRRPRRTPDAAGSEPLMLVETSANDAPAASAAVAEEIAVAETAGAEARHRSRRKPRSAPAEAGDVQSLQLVETSHKEEAPIA